MELVKDENGNVKLGENGFPVWRNGDKEIAYDVGALLETNSRVNSESAGRRKDIDALTAKLAAYDGIDPEKARTALDLAANIDAGKLMEAGKVEELKASVGKSYEATNGRTTTGRAQRTGGAWAQNEYGCSKDRAI